jgi:hypothetical protein
MQDPFVFTILKTDWCRIERDCMLDSASKSRSIEWLSQISRWVAKGRKKWEGASPSSLECRLTVGSEIGRSSHHHLGLGLVSNWRRIQQYHVCSSIGRNWDIFQKSWMQIDGRIWNRMVFTSSRVRVSFQLKNWWISCLKFNWKKLGSFFQKSWMQINSWIWNWTNLHLIV